MADDNSTSGDASGYQSVDPTLRAHIYGLVSALGGLSTDDTSTYILGDDVLGCLRDLKRWLKGYDEKLNRQDVARCLSEANVVNGDLVEILTQSAKVAGPTNSRYSKASLGCVEIMVPLTWPLDKSEQTMTINHHRHIPVLKRAQLSYKRSVLNHADSSVLKACCIVALPAMNTLSGDRTARDEGIIKLVLYLFRNILRIEGLPYDDDDEDLKVDVSRSSTIINFSNQGVFQFLLTIVSGIPENFSTQDIILLEILFHMLRNVDVSSILPVQLKGPEAQNEGLKSLLKHEVLLKGAKKKHISTRHNRFGTTVTMQREDGGKSVLVGQSVLTNEDEGLQKLDSTKKWRRPQHVPKSKDNMYGPDVSLDLTARKYLLDFLLRFLRSGFNDLFLNIRKAMERDSDRILADTHPGQYFYVAGWLLKLYRGLRSEKPSIAFQPFSEDFGTIAVVLQYETYIVLMRHIRESLELKSWDEVQAGCFCMAQILLVVSEMSKSGTSEEKQVALNIQSRLFYEAVMEDLVVSILRSALKQGLRYTDVVTELAHIYLRAIEKYSKEHSDMVVKKVVKSRDKGGEAKGSDEDLDAVSMRAISEKRFEFLRCESKFLTETCIDVYIHFLGYYRELDSTQIRRCISFLHRCFVKREMSILLYRLDIISLLHDISIDMRGDESYSEIKAFVSHFAKKLTRNLLQTPALYAELLFAKLSKTAHYLQFGKDLEIATRTRRSPAELEVKPGLSKEQEIGIAVSVIMQDQSCQDQIVWIKGLLSKLIAVRWAQELQVSTSEDSAGQGNVPNDATTIVFDSEEQGLLYLYNAKIQLLMKLLGLKMSHDEETNFTFSLPPDLTVADIRKSFEILQNYTENPIHKLEDGSDSLTWIRKKAKSRSTRTSFSGLDNESSETSDDSNIMLFPDNLKDGNLVHRKKSPKRSIHRKRSLDSAEAAARVESRKQKEMERRKNIKSKLYIASSDDDSDSDRHREFFEREKSLRDAMSKATLQADEMHYREPLTSKKRVKDQDRQESSKRKRLYTPESNLSTTDSDGLGQQDEVLALDVV